MPVAKLAILEKKFEDIKRDGLLLKSAMNNNCENTDELDASSVAAPQRPTRLVKRNISASIKKPQQLDIPSSIQGIFIK